MITIEMWPSLKAGQPIYNVQYDRTKKTWRVVDSHIITLKKTSKSVDTDGEYKYLIETRGKDETRGFEFYLPDEDFFLVEEDALVSALTFNIRARKEDICYFVNPSKVKRPKI